MRVIILLFSVISFSGCMTHHPAMARNHSAAPLEYDLQLADPDNVLGSNRDLFLKNFSSAIADWAKYIRGNGRLSIRIQFDKNTPGGHFDTIEPGKVFLRSHGDLKIYEQSGTYKLRTGKSAKVGEPDILIRVQPEYFTDSCWLDPEPFLRKDPVPKDRQDVATLLSHELGHGFGIDGLRETVTGAIQNNEISLFDSMILNPNSAEPTFAGPHAKEAYGQEVPLTRFRADDSIFLHHHGVSYKSSQYASQSFYHYGRFADGRPESDLTFHGLMSGVWLYPDKNTGLRLRVSRLDAALLRDLGVPSRE